MNLQNKQTAFHARQVCTPCTHKQTILARLQWVFPVLYCTSGPFSRAGKLGRCQKWLQLPPGLRLDDRFKMNLIQVVIKWGNPVLPGMHFCQVLCIGIGSCVATGMRQVRNVPSEKQPIKKNWAVCRKLSVILVQLSRMHTQRSTEQFPWGNQSKLPSPSIFPDVKIPGKSYRIYVCQDKLQGKQNKIL